MTNPLAVHKETQSSGLRCRATWMCIASFVCGFWLGICRTEHRATELSRDHFNEFLLNADKLGIIDHTRMEEIICIMSEAEWEDRDAADRGVGTE